MLTREMLKNEIDQLQEKYLYVLYRAIKALKPIGYSPNKISNATETKDEWQQFVSDMYGALRDESFERSGQGEKELNSSILF